MGFNICSIQEKRLVFFAFEKLQGLVGKAVGEVLTGTALDWWIATPLRPEVVPRHPATGAANVDIETLVLGPVWLVAKVPFAYKARGIAGLLQ